MKKLRIPKKMQVDIISTLPDSLLSHILSFLPTKYAVGTSILSTRWRYLWVPVPHLEINEGQLFRTCQNPLKYHYPLTEVAKKQNRDIFIEFVNRVLFVDDGPCLQKFSLRFFSYEIIVEDILDHWISAIVGRCVREVEIEYVGCQEDIFSVPKMLFACETLVCLKLKGASLWRGDSVCLPCLKVLKLQSLEYDYDDTMQKLFSGCPLLEELEIERCECYQGVEMDLSVSVPTLKRLRLISPDIGAISDNKLVVDAPRLDHLDIDDFQSANILLQNLQSLSKASIAVGLNIVDSTSSSLILSPLSNVKFLDANWFNEVSFCKMPTFRNLTQLKLGGENNDLWDLKLLGIFLECSPNLEFLTLEGGRRGSWKSPKPVATCLLLHLKKVHMLNFTGKKHELYVIKYLLGKAQVLKKMTIECKCSDGDFYKALTAFPKGSKTCQLRLLL